MAARRIPGVMAVAVVLGASVLAGCSSSGGSEGSSRSSRSTSTTKPEAATTSTTTKASDTDAPGLAFTHGWPKGSGGECDGRTPGQGGVLMTFCHGPAKVTVTIGTEAHQLAGVCWIDAGSLEVDAGVTVGRGWKGAWPDYVTLRSSASTGPTGNIVVAWIDGTEHLVQDARGAIAAAGKGPGISVDEAMLAAPGVTATFAAQDLARTPVKVDVTC